MGDLFVARHVELDVLVAVVDDDVATVFSCKRVP